MLQMWFLSSPETYKQAWFELSKKQKGTGKGFFYLSTWRRKTFSPHAIVDLQKPLLPWGRKRILSAEAPWKPPLLQPPWRRSHLVDENPAPYFWNSFLLEGWANMSESQPSSSTTTPPNWIPNAGTLSNPSILHLGGIPILNATNYGTWSKRIKVALKAKLCYDAVFPPANLNGPDFEVKDARAQDMILSALNDDESPRVSQRETAKAMWDQTEKPYAQRSQAHTIFLKQKLYSFRMKFGKGRLYHLPKHDNMATRRPQHCRCVVCQGQIPTTVSLGHFGCSFSLGHQWNPWHNCCSGGLSYTFAYRQ